MKEIVIPTEVIYEFQVETPIVDFYLEKIKNSPINYQEIGEESTGLAHSLLIGYPIPYYKELFDVLHENLNKVGTKVLNQNFKICDAWVTCSKFGCQSGVHDHGYSVLSGLLYLDDSNTFTEFYYTSEFFRKHKLMFGNSISVLEENKKIQVKPVKGKLLIWPSYIQHKVSVHKEHQNRYTLAFNAFVDGIISKATTGKLSCNTNSPIYLEDKL